MHNPAAICSQGNNAHLMLMKGRTWSTFFNNMLRNSIGSGENKRDNGEQSVIDYVYVCKYSNKSLSMHLSHHCWLLTMFPNAPSSFLSPSQIQSEQHHS